MKNFLKNAALLWLSISGNILGQRQNTQLLEDEEYTLNVMRREHNEILYSINTLQYMVGYAFFPNPKSIQPCSELYPAFNRLNHISYVTPKNTQELQSAINPCLSLTHIMFTEEWLKDMSPRINSGLTINAFGVSSESIKKLITQTTLGTQVLRIVSAQANQLNLELLELFISAGIKEIYIDLQDFEPSIIRQFQELARTAIMDKPDSARPNVFVVNRDYVYAKDGALKTASLVKCKYGEQYGDCLDRMLT